MRYASICVNVVIGVLVVLCELHVTRVVVVDVATGVTLGLIVHVVVVVFVVAILHRIFLYMEEYSSHHLWRVLIVLGTQLLGGSARGFC